MGIDLETLTETELIRLESILRALPAGQLLDQVDWTQIGKAVRTPDDATVAGTLQRIERARSARGSKELLAKKIRQIGERLRSSPRDRRELPSPTPREVREFFEALHAVLKKETRRIAWIEHCCRVYGDHRGNPAARPWPPMPKDWNHEQP